RELWSGGISFFFFQAEDGIRDYKVTGVQTCALPIYQRSEQVCSWHRSSARKRPGKAPQQTCSDRWGSRLCLPAVCPSSRGILWRSEERRVGKECRSPWATEQQRKKRRDANCAARRTM